MTTELPPGLEDRPASRPYPLRTDQAAVILAGLAVWGSTSLWTQSVFLVVVGVTMSRWAQ